MIWLTNLPLCKGPRVLEVGNDLDKRLVIFQLGINQFDIRLVLSHELSIGHKGATDVLRKICDGEGILHQCLLLLQLLRL